MTAATCGTCGTGALRGDAKFCDECGAPIAQAHKVAEYKQVTVLFADVVHSMQIAAAVGAERLREIMTGLVNRATVVVERYGGTVGQVHRRWDHGAVRGAGRVGGSCFPRVPGRPGYPEGDSTPGRRGPAP